MKICYCSNVHPGRNLDELQLQLAQHSLAVKQLVAPNSSIGIGLWLSATAALELANPQRLAIFRDWLDQAGLMPFTFNGFPFGDFHQPIVKHNVYRPTWADDSRLEYTIRLAEIQDQLLPPGMEATISTLPLGWPEKFQLANDNSFTSACAVNLRRCALRFEEIENRTNRNILLCIEPEPGCLIDTSVKLVDFFEEHLLTGISDTDSIILRHIGVCHDICHSAVMFEEQHDAIGRYADVGIQVGKIQVSSAVHVDFATLPNEQKKEAIVRLCQFNEPRYLHQTSVRIGEEVRFFEDLSEAIEQSEPSQGPSGEWRVHFHVPIFAKSWGPIETTQSEIANCLRALREFDCPVNHFEIETYAWNVLPTELQTDDLAKGIAREWAWFENSIKQVTTQ